MDPVLAQQYLAEAEAARHRLAMGEREVEISSADGRRTMYALANMAELDSYIAKLRSDAVAASGATAAGRRPIGYRFGR